MKSLKKLINTINKVFNILNKLHDRKQIFTSDLKRILDMLVNRTGYLYS